MAEKLSPTEARLADAALDALATIDRVLTPSVDRPAKASPTALHAYATDPAFEPDGALLTLLDTDPAAQADFQRLLENTSFFHMPQMAAASTGDISTREAGGCRIVFRPSKADIDHVYAIVEINDPDRHPEILFVRHPDGHLDRLTLPPFREGRAQLLLERSSPAAKGLMDIHAEVYVK